MSAESLKQRVYLSVGSWEKSFDPSDLTFTTGVSPTESWRAGDERNGRARKSDNWSFEPSDDGSSLTSRTDAIYLLAESKPSLFLALEQFKPVIQYAIETGPDEAREFTISSDFIRLLADHAAQIDCDLYWVCEPSFKDGVCTSCHLRVQPTLSDLLPFIGGEARAAELQIKLRLGGVTPDAVGGLINASDENERRLADGLEVAYFQQLACAQFSSDFVPTSDSIESLSPERWLDKFLSLLTPQLGRIGTWSSAELIIRLIERSDFQGAAGLHFDNTQLSLIRDLGAALSVRLSYIPEPLVKASGSCFHCDVDLLATQ